MISYAYAAPNDLKRELLETDMSTNPTFEPFVQGSLMAATAWIEQIIGYKGVPEVAEWNTLIGGIAYVDQNTGILLLPRPMLACTQVVETSGVNLAIWDGTRGTFAAAQVLPYPSDHSPIIQLRRVRNGQPAAWSDRDHLITVDGIWGYHSNYATAWSATPLTLSALVAASPTILSFGVNNLDDNSPVMIGSVIRIGSEVLIVSGREARPGKLQVVRRADLGSTIASHAQDSVVDLWQPDPKLNYACARLAALIYKKRGRFETFVISASDAGATTTIYPKTLPGEVEDILNAMPRFGSHLGLGLV